MRAKILIFFILIVLLIGGIGIATKVPEWKQATRDLLTQAQVAGLDPLSWQEVTEKSEDLPMVYPFTKIKKLTILAQDSAQILSTIPEDIPSFTPETPIPTQNLNNLFEKLSRLEKNTKKIQKNVSQLPTFGLSQNEKDQIRALQQKLVQARKAFDQIETLQRVLADFTENEERLLVLLQNQNEPRSTGGFVGSVMLIDFGETDITWKFSDIYALDRQVPENTLKLSPDFFQALSPTLSLRDANIYPDFPTTAKTYQDFFVPLSEKTPDTILAINLNTIKELLRLTGPITLEKWNIEANESNFDMILSLLVEAKVSGRFNVKDPVMNFATELLSPEQLQNVSLEALQSFDVASFLAHKNILAYSKNKRLQKLFEHWDIDGAVIPHPEVDNFLQFDFVSVGANKTEKFMWTKVWHDSRVLPSGKVINTLEIKRNHSIRPGELDALLGSNNWFENIRDLLTEDIRWKLGEGQNRTIIRVSVPTNARIITQFNPSGVITEDFSKDGKRKIFNIPAYVSAGENNTITLAYETTLKRGSHNWRPYVLQLIGTPGRAQSTFLQTISAQGQFTAETFNIGRPVELIDQDFRAVVDFRE